jgi:hypothetical protein
LGNTRVEVAKLVPSPLTNVPALGAALGQDGVEAIQLVPSPYRCFPEVEEFG